MKDFDTVKTTIQASLDKMVELETLLTSIPAIAPDSGGDGELEKCVALKDYLIGLGFSEDSFASYNAPDERVSSGVRPNLILTIPGKKDDFSIWVMAHLDVVSPGDLKLWETDPWKLVQKDGKLIGRGVEDNQQGLTKKALAKAASRDNWTLQAVLSDTKGHRDSWNVIGAGAAAEQPEPPEGMGDHVNLSLLDGKRALAKSIRSADEASYEWNMALSATGDRVGYLKFEGVKALNEMGLKVFVTVDGKTTEALAGDSLKVLLKAAGSTATVRVAPMDARALASKVENLRFEQASGRLQVGFDVSEGLAGANYVVQLVGLNGKIAASYGSKAFFGHNTVALNVPKSGIYLLRVRVGSEQATRKVAISR